VRTLFERITFDPKIMGGKSLHPRDEDSCFGDPGQIAHGATPEEILMDHPDLEAEDVSQALRCAA
jgi:uncharacterized protein (DUF433 family)